MQVAVFGGSFNPPHVGHAMVAGWLGWVGRADEVWLVPAFHHAFDKPMAAFERRVAACERLAALVGPWVRVDPVEAELPTPSYTLATLDALAARHPEHRFRLVVGADAYAQRRLWHRWDELSARYAPIVVGRGPRSAAGAPSFPDVSSTEVRRRLAAGEAVDAFVPAAVLAAWQDG